MELLNKKLLDKDKIATLKREFSSNLPFPHIVINNFLEEKAAQDLLKALKKEKFTEKSSDLFHFNQTRDLMFSKIKEIKEFSSLMNSKKFHSLLFDITGIPVNKSADLFGSIYQDTDYLLCHDDRLQGRKIAFIFYLTSNFDEKNGGKLCLLESSDGKPSEVVKSYKPTWNSFIMFEVSNKSYHEVEEVIGIKKRYALGGWFH